MSRELEIEYSSVFEFSPDLYLLLSPDFTILNASITYLKSTLVKKEDAIGRHLFDVFPNNPSDPNANGVEKLRYSLNKVLAEKKPHKMEIQKYDIANKLGEFQVRYWSPLNTPVVNNLNEVIYIIHRVEDVTELVTSKLLLDQQIVKQSELEIAELVHKKNLRNSENRYSKIFNFSPVAIFKARLSDGVILRYNKAFERLFSVSDIDIIGKTALELNIISGNELATLQQFSTEIFDEIIELELNVKVSANENKHLLASFCAVEANDEICFLAALVDITQRKDIENDLIRVNNFLDAILENIPNMVFVKDATDLRFLRFNKAGEELLGIPREELIGKNDHDLFSEDQADFFIEKDREAIATNELVDIEEPILTKYGERWLHTRKIPIYDKDKPLYLLGISEDISEKKKQQDSIIDLNKELESFTYSVSHDLRAPLRAVNGYARILTEDYSESLNDEGKRLLSRISRNAEKMGNLIDDLLSFSRLGRKELQRKFTDMNLLVNNAIHEINRTTENHAEIVVNPLHAASVDKGLINQVFVNLIGNAIKYSSKIELPKIEISSKLSDKEIIYTIKDNGAGFDMAYVDKLFGVFQRLHRTDEFEGTGVGLAIVHRIIKKHNGRVWAEGVVNQGATFSISIPVQ